MLARLLVFGLALALELPGAASAQEAALHHIHLAASDPEEGVRWYMKYMGCTAMPGYTDRCQAGSFFIWFFKRGAKGGSAGSGIDHLGWSFSAIAAKAKELEAGGVKIVRPLHDSAVGKVMLVEDPWGTQIEVTEDRDYLGFHHIRLSTAHDDTLQWYQKILGGRVSKMKGALDGLLVGRIWLIATRQNEGAIAPTEGRSVDHVAFSVPNLDAAADAIRKKRIRFTREPWEPQNAPFRRASTIVSPDGVRVELVQP